MNEQRPQVLCVDDETNVLSALQRLFIDDDYEIFIATSGLQGLEILEQHPSIQVVISDYRMPGMDGIEFLEKVWKEWPHTVRIVVSGNADAIEAVNAIKEGHIYGFFAKPWVVKDFRDTVAKGIEVYSLRQKNELLANELLGQQGSFEEPLVQKVFHKQMFTF